MKGAPRISELAIGDLCTVINPHNFFEPVSVLRIVNWATNGDIEGQFYGRHTFDWYIDRRLAKFAFLPSWYQPSDRKFYYASKPMHYTHPPFTNILSKETFNTRDIVAFGFSLQKNLKIPKAIVRLTLEAWRNMQFKPDAIGEPVCEAKDDDLEELRT